MAQQVYGNTLQEAISNSLSPEHLKRLTQASVLGKSIEVKSSSEVWAPPLTWGPWVEVYREWRGSPSDGQKKIEYRTVSRAKSSFDVQITVAGEGAVQRLGPGSEVVSTPGNSIFSIKVRARSHSLGQHVRVTVW